MTNETSRYYVYIETNKNNTVLYIGFTNDLKRRVKEHRNKRNKGFTSRYNVDKCVYCESTPYVNNALKSEKQIKKWNRQWKENLIIDMNPDWEDLLWMFEN